jgi:metal-dependent hydrolase (beta-lactamase superfamily II)
MDERFVAVKVKDKGLIVFTACSHAGVINVLKHAKTQFPRCAALCSGGRAPSLRHE